jgi:DNA-binding CsgD family transcriptional regulator
MGPVVGGGVMSPLSMTGGLLDAPVGCEGTVVVHRTKTLTCTNAECAVVVNPRAALASHTWFVPCSETLGEACTRCHDDADTADGVVRQGVDHDGDRHGAPGHAEPPSGPGVAEQFPWQRDLAAAALERSGVFALACDPSGLVSWLSAGAWPWAPVRARGGADLFVWELFGSRQECRRIAEDAIGLGTPSSHVFSLDDEHEVQLQVQYVAIHEFDGLLWQGSVRPSTGGRSAVDYVESLGSSFFHLTGRERMIVGWLAKGARTRQIAERLYISQSAVRNHLSAIYRKIGVPNQGALVERLLGSDPAGGDGS